MSLHKILEQYLRANGRDEERWREDLIAGIFSTVSKRVSRAWSGNAEDAKDISLDCIERLWSRVNALKLSGECPITNLDALVGTIVKHRICDEIRAANPERRRLDREIEHLLNGKLNVSGFSVWEDPRNGSKVGGFEAWNGQNARAVRNPFHNPRSKQSFAKRWLGVPDLQDVDTADLVDAVFNWHNGPMLVDDLVNIVCALKGIERQTILSLDMEVGDQTFVDTIRDSANIEEEVTSRLAHEDTLRQVWMHLKILAVYQLTAICLKLEPDEFMALTGVAGLSDLAKALGVSREKLADYAGEVPMPDSKIADILGFEAKQIPSIRKKALQRIERRMKKDYF